MLYRLYDIPNWLFGTIVIFTFVSFAIGGLYVTHKRLGVYNKDQLEANGIISAYFGAVVAFYGITLGLISVGAWQNFSDVENKAAREASAIGALYRDVSNYPEPAREALRTKLKDYTKYVIDVAWPQQRKGIVPTGGTERIQAFEADLYPFEPKTMSQLALHQETLRQFNSLIELRNMRLQSVAGGLPATIWWVVCIGAMVSIALTWLFLVDSFRLHELLTGVYAGLIGLLVFLMASMDNPYRGKFSVGPDAFELVLNQLMK
jgi:Kef-type K+ transport system membrane component KefB